MVHDTEVDAVGIMEFLAEVCVEGLYEVRSFRRGGGVGERWWFDGRGDLEAEAARIAAVASRGDHEVYLGINPRDREAGTADAVSRCWWVWADDDRLSPAEAVEVAMLAGMPEPSIVVASGRGSHLYWRLEEPVEPSRFTAIQRGIAETLGTDPAVCDPPRVMRIPGSLNRKTDPPSACVAVSIVHDEPHQVEDLGVPEIEHETPRLPEGIRQSLGGRSTPHPATAAFVKKGLTGEAGNDGRRRAAWMAAVDLKARGYSSTEIASWIERASIRAGMAGFAREIPGMLRRLDARGDWSPRLTAAESMTARIAAESAGDGEEDAERPDDRLGMMLDLSEAWRHVAEGPDREPLPLPMYVSRGIGQTGTVTRGSRIILGGQPGAGKTALAVNWMDHLLRVEPDRRCLWLTMDMSTRRIADRFQQVSSHSSVRSLASRPGVPPLPPYADRIRFVDTVIPATTIGALHAAWAFDYLVIDLLQDLEIPDAESSVVAQDRVLQEVTRFLSAHPGITVFATSEAAKPTGGRKFDVDLALRGSNKIRHWCDVIWVGVPLEADDEDGEACRPGRRIVRWHCGKARDCDASRATFAVEFDGETQVFRELPARYPAAVPA